MRPNLSLTFHLLLLLAAACSTTGDRATSPTPTAARKIKFRLDDIRPDGLRGPPAGLVSVAYEFCAPNREDVLHELKQIDPALRFHRGSPGRIGCSKTQTLCIGETHQPRWREILHSLASLDYISEIRRCHFE